MNIIISGAHGTGKTTVAYLLAGKIKMTTRADVRVKTELARECPFQFCQNQDGKEIKAGTEAQWWIFASQMLRDLENSRDIDRITICDRGLVDVIGYSSALGFHNVAFAMMQVAMAMDIKNIYNHVIFMPISDMPLVNDGCRSLDRGFQQEVEHSILSAWNEIGIKFKTEEEVMRATIQWPKRYSD
jgi:predicted ATPase